MGEGGRAVIVRRTRVARPPCPGTLAHAVGAPSRTGHARLRTIASEVWTKAGCKSIFLLMAATWSAVGSGAVDDRLWRGVALGLHGARGADHMRAMRKPDRDGRRTFLLFKVADALPVWARRIAKRPCPERMAVPANPFGTDARSRYGASVFGRPRIGDDGVFAV